MEMNEYFFLHKLEWAASKQAYSKKREKLNPEVFIEANNEYVKSIYEKEEIKLFNNKYIVSAIDGTTGEIPNVRELQEKFGMAQGEVARTRNSAIYDCLNNVMIAFNINGYKSGERELAEDNIRKAKALLAHPLLVIFDRGYPSIGMFDFLEKEGVKFIIRLQDNTFTKELKGMKTNDEWVKIELTKSRISKIKDKKIRGELREKGTILVRIIKYELENGTTEYLITNLSNEEISYKELGEMYFKRWGIETAYDILKNKLYIENVSGKSEIAVRQDYYATFLAFNMLEDLKNDANEEVTRKIENGNKYDYQVNINVLAGVMKLCLISIILESNKKKAQQIQREMMRMIQRELVSIRPGRQYPHKKYVGNAKHRPNLRRNC